MSDNTQVYNHDCELAMISFPDKYWDLAIVDPPYGINAAKMDMGSVRARGEISTATKLRRLNGGAGKLKNRILNKSTIDWDNEIPSNEYWDELFRVSKNQIICGGNYFPLPPSRGVAVWDKMQPWDNFSQVEIIWTSFDTPARLFRYSNTGNEASGKIHPTQKPVALYKWLLKNYAKEGDKILDTHLGSGSSRIAAFDMGFDFTGYELDKDYFEAHEKRFRQHKSQLTIFPVDYKNRINYE